MIAEREQQIRECINFTEHFTAQGNYNDAAWMVARLKYIDYLNPEIYRLERNPELSYHIKSFSWEVDPSKVYCAFRRVYANPRWGKDNFQLTDKGYEIIVTSDFMPNRAEIFPQNAWRERQKTDLDQTYFDIARAMIYHYSLKGFDTIEHPGYKE